MASAAAIHYSRMRPGWNSRRALGRCPRPARAHFRSSFCLLLLILVALSLSIFRPTLPLLPCSPPPASGPTHSPVAAASSPSFPSSARASLAAELSDYWRPPLVHRSILGKLASLEEEGEEEIAGSLGTDRLMSSEKSDVWPPRVTRIPDDVAALSGTPLAAAAAANRDLELDYALCNASPCRLLLPAYISGKESKARLHVGQLAHLARALGRTLVLPNVGSGRISTCSKWDFGFYYHVSGLEDGTAAANFTSFRRWAALRARRPDAQLVTLLPAPTYQEEDNDLLPELDSAVNPRGVVMLGNDATQVFVARAADPAKASRSHCLQGRAHNLRFGRFSPLQLRPTTTLKHHHRHHLSDQTLASDALYHDFGHGVVRALSSPLVLRESARGKRRTALLEPDVLVVIWELRHPIFPPTASPTPASFGGALRYSDRWSSLAQAVSERLQPFVAVHWGMGGVSPASLPDCAALLASSLAALLSQHGLLTQVKSVYLSATAREADDGQEDSGTPQAARDYHRNAVQLLHASFKNVPSLAGVRLTDLASELDSGGLVREEIRPDVLDSGLVGVIDKMVAKDAALFISSGTKKCGRTSPFTEQIIEDRKQARAAGIQLFNEVELFG